MPLNAPILKLVIRSFRTNSMNTKKSPPTVLTGDFAEGFTDTDARMAFDTIAERMARIVEIVAANPEGLTGAALIEIEMLARLTGLEADSTAGDHGDLNKIWGIRLVASEIEAQALAAIAIDKARGL